MLIGFLFFFAIHRRCFGSHPILISLEFLSFSTEWEKLYFASFVKQWVSFPIFLLVILLILILEAENRLNVRDCVDLLFYISLKEREMRQKKTYVVLFYYSLYALYVHLPTTFHLDGSQDPQTHMCKAMFISPNSEPNLKPALSLLALNSGNTTTVHHPETWHSPLTPPLENFSLPTEVYLLSVSLKSQIRHSYPCLLLQPYPLLMVFLSWSTAS